MALIVDIHSIAGNPSIAALCTSLQSLVPQLLNRILFKTNGSFLLTLGADDDSDSDDETDSNPSTRSQMTEKLADALQEEVDDWISGVSSSAGDDGEGEDPEGLAGLEAFLHKVHSLNS